MFSQFSKLSNRHGDLICHQGSMICSRLYIFTFSPLFPVSKFHCLHKTFYQRFSLLSIYARNIPRSLDKKSSGCLFLKTPGQPLGDKIPLAFHLRPEVWTLESRSLSLGQHGGRFSRVSVGKAIQISSLKVVETISITVSSFFFSRL